MTTFRISQYCGKKNPKIIFKNMKIRAPYDRIISQLQVEDNHSKGHNTHESHRCQAYAQQVLDKFGDKFTAYTGLMVAFRSQVLSPILARQLVGIPNTYSPSIEAALLNRGQGGCQEEVTIGMVTDLYLSVDLMEAKLIPGYRYHVIHIPEVRWHLVTVLGNIDIMGGDPYNAIQDNQDILMAAYQDSTVKFDRDGDKPPPLNIHMVRVVVKERLEGFFKPELDKVARPLPLLPVELI